MDASSQLHKCVPHYAYKSTPCNITAIIQPQTWSDFRSPVTDPRLTKPLNYDIGSDPTLLVSLLPFAMRPRVQRPKRYGARKHIESYSIN